MKLMNPTKRLDRLRASLTETQERLTAKRSQLGVAVADEDEQAAKKLRTEVARLEARCSELESAVPVGEQRVQEAIDREERARLAKEARAHNERRDRCIRAAGDFDRAMKQVGESFAALATEFNVDLKGHRVNLPVNVKIMLRGATYHHALQLGRVLGVESVPHPSRVPLASAMEALPVKEINEDD